MFLVQLKMVLRNVQANWKHSLAAILSLASGYAALSIFESYFIKVQHLYKEVYGARSMYGDFLVEKQGAQGAGLDKAVEVSLSEPEQQKIFQILSESGKEQDHVRFLNFVGTAQSGATSGIVFGYGYDVKAGRELRGESWGWNANAGIPLDVDGGQKVLLGKTLARILGCQFDEKATSFTAIGYYPPVARPFTCPNKVSLQTSTDAGQMNALLLDVAGISDAGFAELDSRFVAIPLESAQTLLNTKRVSMISVKLKPGVDRKAFLNDFRSKADAAGLKLSAMAWEEHPYGDLYLRSLDYLRIFRGFVMIVIIMIVSMSVLNTFMKLVVERTREIGTLRSLGYVPGFIIRLFAIEGFVLALMGTLGGLAITLVGIVFINWAKFPYKAGILSEPVPFVVEFAPLVYLWVGAFLGGLAALTATVSSWNRAWIHLPDALSSN